jgi:hypothetical protein
VARLQPAGGVVGLWWGFVASLAASPRSERVVVRLTGELARVRVDAVEMSPVE